MPGAAGIKTNIPGSANKRTSAAFVTGGVRPMGAPGSRAATSNVQPSMALPSNGPQHADFSISMSADANMGSS